MSEICRGVLLLCVGSLGIQALAIDVRGADKVAAQAPPGYSSPREAFEARRKALAKRDWRTCFASLTPAIQDLELRALVGGWSLMGEGMEGGPFDRLEEDERSAAAEMAKLRAVMKKYGVEFSKIWAEYDKEYHATHGVDLAKLKAEIRKRVRERTERYLEKHRGEREVKELENYLKEHPEAIDDEYIPPGPGEEPDPSLPELDDEVFAKTIKTMTSRVTNKAAFYEEASEIVKARGMETQESVYDLGDLQGVVVSGDSAKGWIVWTSYGFVDGVKKASERKRLLRTFRRLDGRWYNDSEAWDFTRFDPEEVRR